MVFSFEPVFAMAIAAAVLHETVGLRGWLGAALILAGLLYSQVRPVMKARRAMRGFPAYAAGHLTESQYK